MAVRAHDFALFDLVENVLPPALGEVSRDLKRFLALFVDVIEVEHNRVALSAIGAGMLREVLEQKEGALDTAKLFLRTGLLYVPGLVGEVVLTVVGGVTGAAHVVTLPLRLTPPRELRDGLSLTAATAPT